MTNKELILKSTSTLKRMLKTADEDLARAIWAELNCRGVYPRGKGPKY